ncbi:hypothetical protein EVAR_22981_1 [Eumeta japonica]|uniref:Uncharacterized protein n=1 Tax=Eumeta variegata TaxID=151549 RepID=A0A4C1UQ00_EUMVA|nr:hypothetical protein EVAR_22981_1 [Eumeta japonica]
MSCPPRRSARTDGAVPCPGTARESFRHARVPARAATLALAIDVFLLADSPIGPPLSLGARGLRQLTANKGTGAHTGRLGSPLSSRQTAKQWSRSELQSHGRDDAADAALPEEPWRPPWAAVEGGLPPGARAGANSQR